MKTDKILIYDIETLKPMFTVDAFIPEKNIHVDFSVNKNVNQLYAFIKFVDEYKDYHWVGYNNIRFDAQVIEYIIQNYQKWYDKGWREICTLIHQKAMDVIDDGNYDILPDYTEQELTLRQIDLFLIWHFNNKNRMVSLKRLEFEMDVEDIEEMPVSLDKEDFTDGEIDKVSKYCRNDVDATYMHYLFTIGQVDHAFYKGKNKIVDRKIIEEETGLKCLNWDDVKIGAEWNKMDYIHLTGKLERDLWPKKVNHFYGKRYGKFFPKTAKFQTQALKNFVRTIGNTFIINKKQNFVYKFNDELSVNIAKGGLHSMEKGRLIIPDKDEIYMQCDIGSQYPNAIRKYGVYPSHLGKEWNKMLTSKIEKRLYYKRKFAETGDPKFASLQEMGKLSLNGGAYGRLNSRGDWQEDPCSMLTVTIGCQMEILMIVEALIIKNFRVVSVNTDGFDVVIKKNRYDEFMALCSYYENEIGNSELGKLEYTEFEWIAQTSVNDYIALKKDGGIKKKGDFTTDFELHKNKSARIVPLALEQYFVNGRSVHDFITTHDNVYDFCIRQKASKNFHYEGVDRVTGNTTVYDKLIRYYVSNTGEKLYKIKNPICDTRAPARSQIEAGKWLCTVRNYLPKTTRVEDCDINYDYYVQRTEKIIRKVDKMYAKTKPEDKQQLSLW